MKELNRDAFVILDMKTFLKSSSSALGLMSILSYRNPRINIKSNSSQKEKKRMT